MPKMIGHVPISSCSLQHLNIRLPTASINDMNKIPMPMAKRTCAAMCHAITITRTTDRVIQYCCDANNILWDKSINVRILCIRHSSKTFHYVSAGISSACTASRGIASDSRCDFVRVINLCYVMLCYLASNKKITGNSRKQHGLDVKILQHVSNIHCSPMST